MGVVVVNEKNFDQIVLKSPKPVLVDLWAPWCAPCRMLAPIFEELSGEFAHLCQFAKLNVDENPSIATRYGVMSIPTLILFKGGKPQKQWVGFHSKKELKELLQEALSD